MIELVKQSEKDNGLYQWDTGRKIKLVDESLTIDEIHFSNIFCSEALIVEPSGNTADIPNILLQYNAEIAIYAVLRNADGEQTIYETRMSVRKRAKPSDYVYTETEIKNWDALEKRIKELEDNPISEDTLQEAVEGYLEKNPVKVEVDSVMSGTSTNPVQNKVVAKAIKEVEGKIPTDYVTSEELEGKGYLTEHQSLEEYAKTDDIPDVNGFVTDEELKEAIPDSLPNPKKLTFTGAVSAEYDGSGAATVTIPSGDTVRVEKTESDTEAELEPNKFYVFPEMEELNVTLKEAENSDVVNEYHFVFASGETATTLTLPDNVVIGDLSIDANKIYEISILENMLLSQSWEAE